MLNKTTNQLKDKLNEINMEINQIEQSKKNKDKISLLNEMISLKKENNHLIKEITFLQAILKCHQLDNPLSFYLNSSFIGDTNSFQNQFKENIPNEKFETIYYINGIRDKKRRKNNQKKTKI